MKSENLGLNTGSFRYDWDFTQAFQLRFHFAYIKWGWDNRIILLDTKKYFKKLTKSESYLKKLTKSESYLSNYPIYNPEVKAKYV